MLYRTITIAGNDYQSFADVDEADRYEAASVASAPWDALGSGAEGVKQKGKLLVSATRILAGLAWNDGVIADPLPAAVTNATIELANAMAGGYDAANQQSTASTIKRQKAGSVEQEFFSPLISGAGDPLPFPLPVWTLIRGLVAGSGSSGFGGSIASGTCAPSDFECDYSMNLP